MSQIDLTLEATNKDDNTIHVFLISPLGSGGFSTHIPADLPQSLRAWHNRFLCYHDPNRPSLKAHIVNEYGIRLGSDLQAWSLQSEWRSLQLLLTQQPGWPLRIRFRPADSDLGSLLARLPWEYLVRDRPIWRLASTAPPVAAPGERRVRRPRLLLLIGEDRDLDLAAEIEQLRQLAGKGRLELVSLQGEHSSLQELARQLRDRRGWDGLVYLGHSDADPRSGGRLLLGDGHWLSGLELRRELEQITDRTGRPSFVLLNSCLGLDLADSCLAAGIPWVVCFRELVPSHGASLAFRELLRRLQQGRGLAEAVAEVREELRKNGPVGTDLLLSVVCADSAQPLQLPMSRGRQFRQRLATSKRSQALAAAACTLLGLTMDLYPGLPPGPALLNQRLEWQRHWRARTGAHGPTRPALPVLLLNNGPSAAALGVTPTTNRIPRQLLIRVLERVPSSQVPVVGIDLLLDEPAPFTAELADLLRRQRRRQVFAGYYSWNADASAQTMSRTQPLEELQESGLRALDLSSGIPGPRLQGVFRPPLRLEETLGEGHFAYAIAEASLGSSSPQALPYDAVIDWSLDWSRLITNLTLNQLATLQAAVLLIGTDGTINREEPDNFQAPLAITAALVHWDLGKGQLPEPILQAALAQSMAMGHWLTPQLQSATTALSSGLGLLLAAAVTRRRRRWLPLFAVAVATIPLNLQLGVQQRILIPIALPLFALASTALVRHD